MSRVQKESTGFFKAKSEELAPMRKFLLTALWELALPPKEQSALWLAVEEAATNVIRHAYLYGEGQIRFTVRTGRDFVELSLYDTGRRLEIREGERLDLSRLVESGRKGGLGLYLIEKIMDEVGYVARNGENEFRMRKYTKSSTVPRFSRFSMRTRVSVYGSLILAVLVLAAYFFASRSLEESVTTSFNRDLENLASTLAASSADLLFNRNDLSLANVTAQNREERPELTSLIITDSLGQVWADPFGHWEFWSYYRPPEGTAELPGIPQRVFVSEDSSTEAKTVESFYVMQKIYSGSRWVGGVHFTLPALVLTSELAAGKSFLLKIGLLFLLGGLLAIWGLGAYIARPFEKLVENLRRVKEGEPSVPVTGKDEFGRIASAVNEITAHFKKSQEELLEQEKMRQELELAQEVQQALLPSAFPQIEGMEVAAWYQSAREVGGDFYDFFPAGPNLLGIAVADVSGKGVPGALGMAMVRTALRLEARGQSSPAEILARVNRLAAEGIHRNMFVTCFLALLDVRSRRLLFSSAGHLPMIYYRASEKKASLFNPPGLPLGLQLPEAAGFERKIGASELVLQKGDFFVLFTDGVTEASDAGRNCFGLERLTLLVRESAGLSAFDLVEKVKEELSLFARGKNWGDDVTLVVVKDTTIPATASEFGKENRAAEKGLDRKAALAETEEVAHMLKESGTG
jgi:serine phosphatase RsbU (regulator of sigma subunit)/anti-sigma regulatory factor (Ser/Thr protein kinase)